MQSLREEARREEEAARRKMQDLEAQFISSQLRKEQLLRKQERRLACKAIALQAYVRRQRDCNSYEKAKHSIGHLSNALQSARVRCQYRSTAVGVRRLEAQHQAAAMLQATLQRRARVNHAAQIGAATRCLSARMNAALDRKRLLALRDAGRALSAVISARCCCSLRYSSAVLAARHLQGRMRALHQAGLTACLRDKNGAASCLQARARRAHCTTVYLSLFVTAHCAGALEPSSAQRACMLDSTAVRHGQEQVGQSARVCALQAACRRGLARITRQGLEHRARARSSLQAFLQRHLLHSDYRNFKAACRLLAVVVKRRW